GGTGRAAAVGRGGAGGFGGGADFAGTAAPFGAGAPGAAVAPRGVPQRAQNLKVAALSVMQFGHCFGGAPCASRGAAGAEGGAGGSATVSLDRTGRRCAQVGQTPLPMRSSSAGEGPFAGEGLERRNVPAMRPGTPAWLREGVRVLRRCPRTATGASKQSGIRAPSGAGLP